MDNSQTQAQAYKPQWLMYDNHKWLNGSWLWTHDSGLGDVVVVKGWDLTSFAAARSSLYSRLA